MNVSSIPESRFTLEQLREHAKEVETPEGKKLVAQVLRWVVRNSIPHSKLEGALTTGVDEGLRLHTILPSGAGLATLVWLTADEYILPDEKETPTQTTPETAPEIVGKEVEEGKREAWIAGTEDAVMIGSGSIGSDVDEEYQKRTEAVAEAEGMGEPDSGAS